MTRSSNPVLCIIFFLVFGVAAGAAEDSGKGFFDLGVFAFEDGEYLDAEKNFTSALASDPENPSYYHYLGKTYLKMERYKKAETFLKKARRIDPSLHGLDYDMGMLRYKTADFLSSAAIFRRISEKDPSNVNAVFFTGMSYFHVKRYGEAAKYFEKAAGKSTLIAPGAYYYSGICHVKTGNPYIALSRFGYVKEHAESPIQRNLAEKWIQAIQKRQKRAKPYRFFLSAGYEYDSNVRLEPIDEDIYSDEADSDFKLFLSGSYNFIDTPVFQIGAGYSHYQTFHEDLDQYDLMGCLGNLYTRVNNGPYSFGISYMPSWYRLDGDDYLMSHMFRPDITVKFNGGTIWTLSFSYSIDDYEDDDRDGTSGEISSDFYYLLKDLKAYLLWSVSAGKETSDDPEKEYESIGTNLGLTFRLPLKLELGLIGKFTFRQYENATVSGPDIFYRRDRKYSGGITLKRPLFFEWLKIAGEGNYTRNDSNHKDYDYDKYSFGVSMEISF